MGHLGPDPDRTHRDPQQPTVWQNRRPRSRGRVCRLADSAGSDGCGPIQKESVALLATKSLRAGGLTVGSLLPDVLYQALEEPDDGVGEKDQQRNRHHQDEIVGYQ